MNIVVGILGFIGAASTLGLIGALLAGTLTVFVAWISLLMGAVVGSFMGYYSRFSKSYQPVPGYFDWAAIICFLLFCLRSFLWIYYENGDSIYTLNGYHYADLHIHLSFIQSFVADTPFWPGNPLFAGETLHYHFGMDLFTALFVKAGLPLERALPLIGLACGILTLFALFWWGRGFAVAGFLFSGGLAGYLIFSLGRFEDYQYALPWKNLALTTFLPQRGFLFALPAGLLVLWSWKRRFLESKSGLPFWIEGFLWGVLPFFQIQTFMVLTLLFVSWTFFSRKIKEAVPVYFFGLVWAVPYTLALTDGFRKASLVWWQPGWMIGAENPVIFFLWNFGFFVPLTGVVAWQLIRKGNFSNRVQFFSALTIFFVFMFVMCAPWDWDNVKIFLWCYLIFLPLIDQIVLRNVPWIARGALIFLLFLSGFVCIVGALDKSHQGTVLIKRADLEGACLALKGLDPKEHIATAQEGYHPVSLCGHKVVAGYAGTVSGYFGEAARPVQINLNRLMMGEFDWRQMAGILNARYLFWGSYEKGAYKDSNKPWEFYSTKIAEGRWGSLYDLQKPSALSLAKDMAPPKDLRTDFQAEYYSNENCEGQVTKKETVSWPDFDWNDSNKSFKSPACIIYKGKIKVSGKKTFYLASDDGSFLSIDDHLIIDNGGVHAVRVRKQTLSLEEEWHDVEIKYNDIGGGATLKFWWEESN